MRTTRLLPGLVVLAVAAVLLLRADVPAHQLTLYAAGVLWSVLLPGWLLARWALPLPRSWPAELTWAWALGVVLQLATWAVGTWAGVPRVLLVAVPALLLAGGLAVPRLRARLRLARYDGAGSGAAWTLAGAATYLLVKLDRSTFTSTPLPPAAGGWYRDLYWHLGINAQAMRSVPPVDPQLGDQPLHYHWFSNAHVAAQALLTGQDLVLLTARLWYVPVLLTALLATSALAARLSGRAWVGSLAAVLLVLSPALTPLGWLAPNATDAWLTVSPSQVFGLPLTVALTWLVIDLARGRGSWWHWPVLVALAITCMGAKSSILPVAAGGLVLALVACAVQAGLRSAAVRRTGAVLVVVLAVMVVTTPLLAGGAGASTPGVFTSTWRLAVVAQLLPGGAHGPSAWLLLVGLTVLLLLQPAGVLLAAVLPTRAQDGTPDPAPWVLAGSVVTGLAALVLIDHVGQSQAYLLRGALPLAAVLTAWGASVLVTRHGTALGRPAVVGAALGALLVLGVRAVTGSRPPASLVPAASVAAGVAVGCALLMLLTVRLLRSGARPSGATAGALLAVVLVPGLVAHPWPVRASPSGHLDAGELSATTWLSRHSSPDDLVATNVHCAAVRTEHRCDSRSFWVAGLSRRAVHVGGWAYTPRAVARVAGDTTPSIRRPFWDADRLALNDGAFVRPTEAGLAALHAKGVRWLLADRAAGPVSPRLAVLTGAPHHVAGRVAVYRLQDPSPTTTP